MSRAVCPAAGTSCVAAAVTTNGADTAVPQVASVTSTVYVPAPVSSVGPVPTTIDSALRQT